MKISCFVQQLKKQLNLYSKLIDFRGGAKRVFLSFFWVAVFVSHSQSIEPIPPTIKNLMNQYTWHPGCPVKINDLRLLKMRYWGFDQHYHWGEMIVHKNVANEVEELFAKLTKNHFPIRSIKLIEYYQGNDQASVAADNSSAFNCRALTGNPSKFSLHSYGLAIDINPLENPYISRYQKPELINSIYLNRHLNLPGMINHQSIIYKLFNNNGWKWGGDYRNLKDYHHFEKILPFILHS